MGQGQLLIIILGVIMVGIAIAVGINMFSEHQRQAAIAENPLLDTTNAASYAAQMELVAEEGRDPVTGKYQSADAILSTFVSFQGWAALPVAGKLFIMNDANDTSGSPGTMGVWVCPDEGIWFKTVVIGPDSTVIASVDNFDEAPTTAIK